MLFLFGFSTGISLLGILLLVFSAIYNSRIIDIFASVLLAPAILIVFGINIYTWKKGQPNHMTFNGMVKHDLEEFYTKLNEYYLTKTK